ncbi:hypothetical protein A2Y26_01790 [candidate division CPR2 bacterium GWD2_39_7]|nr:MAG: hypothetical protein A2Y27_03020 [candidate division CPR2 bacterium GWD1_39_7]OGB72449.1 MAG: hypothetical protein A2Y26_01790 [candidate division CPR2 bacterium GWD2_39_7]
MIYSLLVVILIPVLIVLNTYIIITKMQVNLDEELRYKAQLAAHSLNVALLNYVDEPNEVEEVITNYAKFTKDVKNIQIIKKINDDFKIVASLNPEDKGRLVEGQDKTMLAITWYDKNEISTEMRADKRMEIAGQEISFDERLWAVRTPIVNKDGNEVYLANIWVSTKNADINIANTVTVAGIVLVLTIIAVILLILGNSRLFQYAVLFEKLKEVDQMKDDFISTASHELRTPLTIIRGNASILVEDFSRLKKEEITNMHEQIVDSTNRLNYLVNDLLDVSRIEQNRIKLELSEVNVLEIGRKITGEFKNQAKEKGLHIKENFADKPLFSNLDKAKFEQILINIIGNAVKYTKEGEVEVGITSNEKGNSILVRDTGIGMDEDERKQLFSKFYRIRNENTENIPGTGLGLWITKQLIEMMQGKIMVESIKGVGSQFTITFPKNEGKLTSQNKQK